MARSNSEQTAINNANNKLSSMNKKYETDSDDTDETHPYQAPNKNYLNQQIGGPDLIKQSSYHAMISVIIFSYFPLFCT